MKSRSQSQDGTVIGMAALKLETYLRSFTALSVPRKLEPNQLL